MEGRFDLPGTIESLLRNSESVPIVMATVGDAYHTILQQVSLLIAPKFLLFWKSSLQKYYRCNLSQTLRWASLDFTKNFSAVFSSSTQLLYVASITTHRQYLSRNVTNVPKQWCFWAGVHLHNPTSPLPSSSGWFKWRNSEWYFKGKSSTCKLKVFTKQKHICKFLSKLSILMCSFLPGTLSTLAICLTSTSRTSKRTSGPPLNKTSQHWNQILLVLTI